MQIVGDRLGKFGFTALEVDVFEPQQELSAELPGPELGEQRRIGVAEMQIAVRARRKTKDGHSRSVACRENPSQSA